MREWTDAQKDAISARVGPLLVSAAAGSGKTAVLVERVVSRILDPDAPIGADRILVVTFTRAAAAEMRARLEQRLEQEREKNPQSLFLQRQQILLTRAHIGTIDSFCQELVREHFSELGFPADFRVADDSERKILEQAALTEVLERHYGAKDQAFYALLGCFALGRDDRALSGMLLSLYAFTRSHPFPKRWLQEKARLYAEGDPDKTPWGKEVRAYAEEAVAYCIEQMREAVRIAQEDAGLREKCAPFLEAEAAQLQSVEKALSEHTPWDGIGAWLDNVVFDRLPTPRGYKEHPGKAAISTARDGVKKTIKELQKYFAKPAAACGEEIAKLRPLVETLFSLVEEFTETFQAKKAARRLVDFDDLAHGALRLLVREEDGAFVRTAVAEELARQYEEIFVDEYQDTNELQDLLFSAISNHEQNLFLVGDVKQSIYGFRQAQAALFLHRRETSAPYDRAHPKGPAVIVLDRNFRSRAGITEGVNFFFSQLMSEKVGGLSYGKQDALTCGASYPPEEEPCVELTLLSLKDDADEDQADMVRCESRQIAARLHTFFQTGSIAENGTTRPPRPGDVCILLRSAARFAPLYAHALWEQGIPAWADPGTGFFGTYEIRAALAFLQAVDNPLLDIPLLAALVNPIYGFSPDDLVRLRLQDRKAGVYALLQRAAERGDSRCGAFLEDLRRMRALAAALPADAFIESFYRETGFSDAVLAMKDGEERMKNLRLLLDYARRYEETGTGGLSGFLRFLERLQDEGGDLGRGTPGARADAVQIMSIHHSKGLEFPVVILAGTGRRFHVDLDNARLHKDLGFGARLRDEETGCRVTTLPREAIALAQKREEKSEELRVLYVAMTRAKERLWIFASVANPETYLRVLAAKCGRRDTLPPFVVRGADRASDWIFLCALRHPDGGPLRTLAGAPVSTLPTKEPWKVRVNPPLPDAAAPAEETAPAAAPEPDAALEASLSKLLAFSYPYAPLSKVRAKSAASDLAGGKFQRAYAFQSRPAFLSAGGLTPAERGTALHTFLQYADYARAAEDPQKECGRLLEEAYLTPEEARAVDFSKIEAFFASSLGQRILKSPRVLREYRFSMELPAGDVEPGLPAPLSEEPVVVQGALDCAFWEDGAWVIVDYKTDRVHDADALWRRYRAQLSLYREALSRCTGLPVKEGVLYAFSLGRAVTGDFSAPKG